MEAIDEHLRSVLGERKIPLAYRLSVEDEEVAADGITYPTTQDEMIARAPHLYREMRLGFECTTPSTL
jgi:hypothetical protein